MKKGDKIKCALEKEATVICVAENISASRKVVVYEDANGKTKFAALRRIEQVNKSKE